MRYIMNLNEAKRFLINAGYLIEKIDPNGGPTYRTREGIVTNRPVLKGIIVFKPANEGSKSEVELPFLYMKNGKFSPQLFVEGENPFENKILKEYDGKEVTIEVEKGRGNTLIVKNIK